MKVGSEHVFGCLLMEEFNIVLRRSRRHTAPRQSYEITFKLSEDDWMCGFIGADFGEAGMSVPYNSLPTKMVEMWDGGPVREWREFRILTPEHEALIIFKP